MSKEFVNLKLALIQIQNEIYDDNLETVKNIIISRLLSLDCKVLNDYAQDIRQAKDSEQLKKQLGSIISLCDLIPKIQYTLC